MFKKLRKKLLLRKILKIDRQLVEEKWPESTLSKEELEAEKRTRQDVKRLLKSRGTVS